MTGEEYYNIKQGDKVIVTKSTPIQMIIYKKE